MDLSERLVTAGEVTFEIRKLAPMEAYRCWEIIRTGLAPAIALVSNDDMRAVGGRISGLVGGADIEDEDSSVDLMTAAKIVAQMVAALPADVVERLRQRLFTQVWFTTPNVPSAPVAGEENTAFEKLDSAWVYVLLVRAAVVNFRESLVVLSSLMDGLPRGLGAPPEPSTSPTFSPTP